MPLFDPFKRRRTEAFAMAADSLDAPVKKLGQSQKKSMTCRRSPPCSKTRAASRARQIKENVKKQKGEADKSRTQAARRRPMSHLRTCFTKSRTSRSTKQDKLPDKYVRHQRQRNRRQRDAVQRVRRSDDRCPGDADHESTAAKLHYLYDKLKDSPEYHQSLPMAKSPRTSPKTDFNQPSSTRYLKGQRRWGQKRVHGRVLPTETGNMGQAVDKIKEHALTGDPRCTARDAVDQDGGARSAWAMRRLPSSFRTATPAKAKSCSRWWFPFKHRRKHHQQRQQTQRRRRPVRQVHELLWQGAIDPSGVANPDSACAQRVPKTPRFCFLRPIIDDRV